MIEETGRIDEVQMCFVLSFSLFHSFGRVRVVAAAVISSATSSSSDPSTTTAAGE